MPTELVRARMQRFPRDLKNLPASEKHPGRHGDCHGEGDRKSGQRKRQREHCVPAALPAQPAQSCEQTESAQTVSSIPSSFPLIAVRLLSPPDNTSGRQSPPKNPIKEAGKCVRAPWPSLLALLRASHSRRVTVSEAPFPPSFTDRSRFYRPFTSSALPFAKPAPIHPGGQALPRQRQSARHTAGSGSRRVAAPTPYTC